MTLICGDTLELSCAAVNQPDSPLPLTFDWFHNDSLIIYPTTNSTTTSINTVANQLIVADVDIADTGDYHCLVYTRSSEDGVQSAIAQVMVNCKSYQPAMEGGGGGGQMCDPILNLVLPPSTPYSLPQFFPPSLNPLLSPSSSIPSSSPSLPQFPPSPPQSLPASPQSLPPSLIPLIPSLPIAVPPPPTCISAGHVNGCCSSDQSMCVVRGKSNTLCYCDIDCYAINMCCKDIMSIGCLREFINKVVF